MSGDGDTVQTLGEVRGGPSLEEVAKIAREELRETAETRETALQQFREWITKNEDISGVRTDSSFLLRFLRVKKFSLPMAQQTLLKYLNFRKTLSHFFSVISYEDTTLMNMLTSGFIFASPIRDSLGRRVMIYNIGLHPCVTPSPDPHSKTLYSSPEKFNDADATSRQQLNSLIFDPYKHGSDVMAKVFLMSYETVLEDDVTQITGISHFGNLQGASAAYVTIWSPLEFVRATKWGEQSVAMRNKCVNIINMPTSVKYIYDICKGLLSVKLRERFFVHASIDSLKSNVDLKCLPKEYGGEIPMSEMLDLWKKEVLAKKDFVLANKKMQIHNTRGITNRKNNNGCQKVCTNEVNIMSVNGSFRQLNVD